jgi:hypothetical protein
LFHTGRLSADRKLGTRQYVPARVILEPVTGHRVPIHERVWPAHELCYLVTTWLSCLMDCREFRNKHVTFVDDLLPAVEMDAMQRHLTACSRCSRHNTAIRRSLLLVHNLPPIEPSPEFMSKLNARLEQMSSTSRVDLVAPRPYLSSVGAFAALAAGILAVAYMAVETTHYYAPSVDPRVVPVATTATELVPSSVGNGAFVASVPTGIPVWPAVLMVGEAPMHFATMDFHESNATR